MVEPAVLERILASFPENESGVRRCVELLEEGASVPFLAHYRHGETGGLEEPAVHRIEEQLRQVRELERRRASILRQIEGREDVPPAVREALLHAADRTSLEDAFASYHPRRRGRGGAARGKGLEALAKAIREADASAGSLESLAAPFVRAEGGVGTVAEAHEGARRILVEDIVDDPAARALVRKEMRARGMLAVVGFDAAKAPAGKYAEWSNHREPLRSIPAHRLLSLRRGEKEGAYHLAVEVDREKLLASLAERFVRSDAPEEIRRFVGEAVREAYDEFLLPSCAADVRLETKERADGEAIAVYATNLRHFLLTPPFGPRPVLAIETSSAGAWRIAVVGKDGSFLEGAAVRVADPEKRSEGLQTVRGLLDRHGVEGIAVGNGMGASAALAFAREVCAGRSRPPVVALVSDAGLAVHASSPAARAEFPDLDQNMRAAVILARRLRDPLAELVKVEPRAIGLGQFPQDVNRLRLDHALEASVDSCVNHVGVDPNTAGVELLSRVAGISLPLAEAIVARRKEVGPFRRREDLLSVPGFDARAYEQAAGFLRIQDGEDPVERTGVHPEHYELVRAMAQKAGCSPADLLGNRAVLESIPLEEFVTPTRENRVVREVVHELALAGRDRRGPFRAVRFREEVRTLEDLREGMILEGLVRNVTNFGAFVDVGLAQDGLVHVSEMAPRYVRNPQEFVRVGDVVKVRLLGIDRERGRIAFSMRPPPPPPEKARAPAPPPRRAEKPEPASATVAASGQDGAERGAAPAREARDGEAPPRRREGRVRVPASPAPVRAASHRRDGLMPGGKEGRRERSRDGGGGRGQGGGSGRPRGPGGDRGGRRGPFRGGDRREDASSASLHAPTVRFPRTAGNNPFRSFFEKQGVLPGAEPPAPPVPESVAEPTAEKPETAPEA
jgi:uncharacterized protein